jgi:hypothetical protein
MTTDQTPAGTLGREELGKIAWDALDAHLRDTGAIFLSKPGEYPWEHASKHIQAKFIAQATAVAAHVRSDQAAQIERLQAAARLLKKIYETNEPVSKWEVQSALASVQGDLAAHPAPPLETTGDEER